MPFLKIVSKNITIFCQLSGLKISIKKQFSDGKSDCFLLEKLFLHISILKINLKNDFFLNINKFKKRFFLPITGFEIKYC